VVRDLLIEPQTGKPVARQVYAQLLVDLHPLIQFQSDTPAERVA
jgi:hypothetical protein